LFGVQEGDEVIVRGVDSDSYDGDVPAFHYQRLHDFYDVRFNIIGLEAWTPFANQQRANSLSVGLQVPFAYKFLYWRDDDLERMKVAAGFGELVAIDCEAGVPGWSHERVVERIQQVKEVLLAEGRYWGIYTGAWWWPSNTGNSVAFAGDRLWHAAYPFNRPGQPAVLPPQDFLPAAPFGVNYGGWTQATVHQYADTCYEDDAGAWDFDMNAMDEALLLPPPPAVVPVGVGVHYNDGTQEGVWEIHPDRVLDGVGIRYSNGEIERLWPQ
jgi:hypothetical protein